MSIPECESSEKVKLRLQVMPGKKRLVKDQRPRSKAARRRYDNREGRRFEGHWIWLLCGALTAGSCNHF